jgi:hypothetical protein
MAEDRASPDAIAVALRVGETIESVGGAYFVGGSLASSLQGEPRATNDIDLVIDVPEEGSVSPCHPATVWILRLTYTLTLRVRSSPPWSVFRRRNPAIFRTCPSLSGPVRCCPAGDATFKSRPPR